MSYSERPVYERLSDGELEYSLDRASGKLEESVQSFMAALYLEDTRDDSGFDRLVLGLKGEEVEKAENRMYGVKEEYNSMIEEAESRNTDFSDYIVDEDEMIEETRKWIEELQFDRVGLSGVAKNL